MNSRAERRGMTEGRDLGKMDRTVTPGVRLVQRKRHPGGRQGSIRA